jgi:pSer/pThr/pTyr-binding forkhead associated (FHA) protein
LVEVVYPVEAAGTVYGRAGGYWVQIDDPEVSRKHFKIFFRDGLWHVHDLSSRNGVYVNGARMSSATLQSGDTLRVGNQSLVFVLTTKSDLPVTGQPINVNDDAYRQTMRHKTIKPAEAG